MPVIASDIALFALKKSGVIGVGESADEEMPDALTDLADMLALWNEKRWLVWHTVDSAFVSTGAQTYTVGPGGNFAVTPRPAKIEAAFVRQIVNAGIPVDTSLKIIPAREQYNRIALKSLVAFPKYVFYDPASPTGTVTTYPVMTASIYELHLTLKDVFPTTIAANTDLSNLPPFVIPAMKFNLAIWLRQSYGKGGKEDITLEKLAKDTLETVRNAHAAVPELSMPPQLIRDGRYNIFSDQAY
jgi:hypothetical protein